MRESFVQYVWDRQLFEKANLRSVQNEEVVIVDRGIFTALDGPDFFNAKLYIDKQLWAGNVEIHLKASDWFAHRHEFDHRYENVILHVVWESDIPVLRKDGSEVSVLELKHYVLPALVAQCEELFIPKKRYNCENRIHEITAINWLQWKERLFVERLEQKVRPISELLARRGNDWSLVFLCFLAKGFGANMNGDFFFRMMLALPYQCLYKCSASLLQLEALFFGVAGFLNNQNEEDDQYTKRLKSEWIFLKNKFSLRSLEKHELQFFQLRPANFPTVRIAQLAAWFFQNSMNIQTLLSTKDWTIIHKAFDVEVSAYWSTHYVFNTESKFQKKRLTKSFKDSLLINTIVPMQFAFARSNGDTTLKIEELTELLFSLKAEVNSIVESFTSLGVLAEHALDSQALLQLKRNYCDQNKCLNCMVGKNLIKN